MHSLEFTSSHEVLVLVHATSLLVVMANNLKNIFEIGILKYDLNIVYTERKKKIGDVLCDMKTY